MKKEEHEIRKEKLTEFAHARVYGDEKGLNLSEINNLSSLRSDEEYFIESSS